MFGRLRHTLMSSLCLSLQVWVASVEHTRVNMCSLYASPTGLSPYLRFGCLSCRVLYYNLREFYMKVLISPAGCGFNSLLSSPSH